MRYYVDAKTWDEYVTKLAAINEKAAESMQQYMKDHGGYVTSDLLSTAYSITQRYGEAAGSLAVDFYNSIAEQWAEAHRMPYKPAADLAPTATMDEVKHEVFAAQEQGRLDDIPDRIGRLVKQTGADTIVRNAIRDKAEWAWIPAGGETCAFCLMLASRGWTRASRSVLKGNHCEHIHSHCRCTFAVRFSSDTFVQGYDPDAYKDVYDRAGGDLNAIRRELYDDQKDTINEQKRERYAKEQAEEST